MGFFMSNDLRPFARPHSRTTRNRREFIRDSFCGFGSIALAALLHQEQARAAASASAIHPLSPRVAHKPALGVLM